MERVMMRKDNDQHDDPICVRYSYWSGGSGVSVWLGVDVCMANLDRTKPHNRAHVLKICRGCERSADEAMAGLAILAVSR